MRVSMYPSAISRSATTVGLSFSHSTIGWAPFASWRARFAATSTSWNMFGTCRVQSSTVIRAISHLLEGRNSVLQARGAGLRDFPSRRRGPSGAGRAAGVLEHLRDAFRDARRIRAMARAAARDDLGELVGGALQLVIDHDVAEFVPVHHVGDGVPEPPRDDLRRVAAAVLEPRLERG